MPSTLKALQAVFNLYYRSIPCSIQYLLHAIKRQNIGSVQLGGCTQWRCSATKIVKQNAVKQDAVKQDAVQPSEHKVHH